MQRTKANKLDVVFESLIGTDDSPAQSAETNAGQNRKGRLTEFVALASIPLVLVFGNSMIIPILPDMVKRIGISTFQSSLMITLFSLTAAVMIPVSGYLSDRFTRKAVIVPSLILYGAAGILAGLGAVWGSYPVLIAARALQGLGAAGTSSIAMALVGDLYKGGTESKALGLIEASNGTGKVLSPIFGSALALMIWYAPFFAFPVFCLLSLLAVLFLLKEPKKEQEPPKLKDYARTIVGHLREKGRWLISAFFTGSIALFILFGSLFYLSDVLEKSPYSVDGIVKGLVLAIPLLGLVATSYITGSVIKKNGILMRRLINIGMGLLTAALGTAVFLYGNIYWLVGLLTLGGIGTGLTLPCLNTMITGAVDRSERGMITSLYNSLRFFGVALGPPLFGWLMDLSHLAVFIAVTAFALVALALVFFLIKPGREVA